MMNFEVRLSRLVTQEVHTTVSVSAETEEAAIEQALAHARAFSVEWSGDFANPGDYGEIKVVGVEAIVDLDENV